MTFDGKAVRAINEQEGLSPVRGRPLPGICLNRVRIQLLQNTENLHRRRIVEPIEDRLGLAPGRNQSLRPHLGQMLGSRRLRESGVVGEVANRRLSLHKPAEQQEALLAGEQFQEAGGGTYALLEAGQVTWRRAGGGGCHRRKVEDANERSSAPIIRERSGGYISGVLLRQGAAVIAQHDVDGRDDQDGQQGR